MIFVIIAMALVIVYLVGMLYIERQYLSVTEAVAQNQLALSLTLERLLEEAHETIEWYDKQATGQTGTAPPLYISTSDDPEWNSTEWDND